jgi:predicted dehydrogenase
LGRVKLGLIGMGLIGNSHTRTFQRVDECDLVAIADIDEKHAQTATTLGATYYQDYKEMINQESLQGVIVATPNHLHVPVGIACARRGLHLFVEKPIATTLSEASLLFPQMKRLFYSDPAKFGWHFPITEQGVKVIREDDPYVQEFRHFARVIQGEEPPRISGEDARRTLEVTLAIQGCGETGRPVRLN